MPSAILNRPMISFQTIPAQIKMHPPPFCHFMQTSNFLPVISQPPFHQSGPFSVIRLSSVQIICWKLVFKYFLWKIYGMAAKFTRYKPNLELLGTAEEEGPHRKHSINIFGVLLEGHPKSCSFPIIYWNSYTDSSVDRRLEAVLAAKGGRLKK